MSFLFLSRLPYTIWQCNNYFCWECLLYCISSAWSIQGLFPCRQVFQYSHLVLLYPMKSKPSHAEGFHLQPETVTRNTISAVSSTSSVYNWWQNPGLTKRKKILHFCWSQDLNQNDSFHFIHKRQSCSYGSTRCAEKSFASSSQLWGTNYKSVR